MASLQVRQMRGDFDQSNRRKMVVGAIGLALVAGIGGVWAGRTLLAPPPDILAAPSFTMVAAREGTVGQTWRLNAEASWDSLADFPNYNSGVITSISATNGEIAEPGQVLYTVNLRPVVIAEGEIPAFRDLSTNASGTDVAQLQQLLTSTGYFTGSVNGVFDWRLRNSVQAWQRSLGVADTGTISRSDIVFVPDLPTSIALAEGIVIGKEVSGQFPAVSVLGDSPEFTINVTDSQAAAMPVGTVVDLATAEGIWPAVVSQFSPMTPERPLHVVLSSPDGGPVCGNECDQIPVGTPTVIPATIHIVPETSGIVVPTAATVSNAAGQSGVYLEDGEFVPVTIIASALGSSVVTGIALDTLVRTPGDG